MDLSEGQVLVGKYRVERVLGRGGMGVVVAAHHLQLDEKVAIKFLLPEAEPSAELVARFVREARAAVRIKSEHVARVFDVGELESGEPYMVMEYLEGSDLSNWLRRGPLAIEQAVEFVLQASEAIAEAHALGIVHRDLKPANLFVVRRADGLYSVKVLDFGISKLTYVGQAALDRDFTRTAAVLGSPLYMPPEQMAASKSVDARADIWALGVILFELLTGNPPFRGTTLPEVCVKIAMDAPGSLSALRSGIPLALETVVLRCLEKDRERRYPNVDALARALSDFAPARARNSVDRIVRTIQATPSPASEPLGQASTFERTDTVANATTTIAESHSPWGHIPAGRQRDKRALLMVFGGVLVVVAGGLGLAWRRSPSPSAASIEASTPARSGGVASSLAASISVAPTVASVAVAQVASQPATVPVAVSALPLESAAPSSKFLLREAVRPVLSNVPAARNAPPVMLPPVKGSAPKSSIFDDR